jgi:hypothetical protein
MFSNCHPFPKKPPVIFDAPPIGSNFGDIIADVMSTPYHVGDTVVAQFVGANPRVSQICPMNDRLLKFPTEQPETGRNIPHD